MTSALGLDYPMGLLVGVPLVTAALGLWIFTQRRRGHPWNRLGLLGGLRAVSLGLLVFLASRPAWVVPQPPEQAGRPVLVLLDRSESMSVDEGSGTRLQSARRFALKQLIPALKAADLPVVPVLFAEQSGTADAKTFSAAKPDGKRTDLGAAITQSIGSSTAPPLAVIALTDGVVNESAQNARALSALLDARSPFIGVGFGSDTGSPTLSVMQIMAPEVAAPKTTFQISAMLEMTGVQDSPGFDLLLFRDGKLAEQKSIPSAKGPRTWVESFPRNEAEAGTHDFTVQIAPTGRADLKTINSTRSASVRIVDERELRVLYVQGALTWDYKFVSLALQGDPSIKMTGLTRTSQNSYFRQNVETAGELTQGFPSTVAEMASYKVIVLSNMKPADLSGVQQEALAKYCQELGGGVLMIGGPDTFDASWKASRLEQVLPVVFSPGGGVTGLDRAFRIKVTDEALQSPVFQVQDKRPAREVWASLPTFTRYGRVDSAKPGAQIWAEHADDVGPAGRRILMASQRYGAGLSAVITVQNFWRWRLAKDADTQQFDRFWRQMFRYLGAAGQQDVLIHLADQDLRAPMDVHVTLQRQPDPSYAKTGVTSFKARVEDADQKILHEQEVSLQPERPVDFSFRAATAGMYRVSIANAHGGMVATRAIEIPDVNVELQNTARNMEALRQWAALTDGIALKAEDCADTTELLERIKSRIQQARHRPPQRTPFGVNAWMMALVLGSLCTDWILRKRWNIT